MSHHIDDLLETNPKKDKLSSQSAEAQPSPKPTDASPSKTSLADIEITYSPSRVTNYATMKTLAKSLKGFAWLVGIGGVISIIRAIGSLDGGYGSEAELGLYLVLGVIAFFLAGQLSFFSESINVILDIEANSRQAAKTLERLLNSQ